MVDLILATSREKRESVDITLMIVEYMFYAKSGTFPEERVWQCLCLFLTKLNLMV